MKIAPEQYKLIESHLPKQRGNVRMDKIEFINAIIYVAERIWEWAQRICKNELMEQGRSSSKNV